MKGRSINLSEQQLVDCSRQQGNQGCNGGWASSGLVYIRGNGITTQGAYPYVGRDQACKIQGVIIKLADLNTILVVMGLK